MSHREAQFGALVAEVRACLACPRMANSARVLGFGSGDLHATVFFIGEAPGRLGADQTEIPFHGDVAGANFEDFLRHANLSRETIFVTNAALCNPKDELGRNATPTSEEISNCSGFLRRQILLVNPDIVVTLGATALAAVSLIEKHGLTLRDSVRTSNRWFGRKLIPLYHPGQRAIIHRSKANQRSDYQFVSEQLRRPMGALRRDSAQMKPDVLDACKELIRLRGEVSYFALHKLAYLLEYVHVQKHGSRLTSAYFIRQKDGPYCVDLSVDRIRRSGGVLETTQRGGRLFVRFTSQHQSDATVLFQEHVVNRAPPSTALPALAEEVIKRYTYPDDADLKRAVYLTAPMRVILRRESRDGVNLFNSPINFLASAEKEPGEVSATT